LADPALAAQVSSADSAIHRPGNVQAKKYPPSSLSPVKKTEQEANKNKYNGEGAAFRYGMQYMHAPNPVTPIPARKKDNSPSKKTVVF
jgi:hypothetical protein